MPGRLQKPINPFGNCLRKSRLAVRENRIFVVEPIKQIAAHVEFFQKPRIGRCRYVHIAVIALVTIGVVSHSLLERTSNADVINDQATLFTPANAIHTRNGLHKVMALHWLEYIHCSQAGHIEASEPHINDNGDLQRIVLIFELALHLFFMRGSSAYLEPVCRVLVPHSHDYAKLIRPIGAQLHHAFVNLHSDSSAVSNHQCFSS